MLTALAVLGSRMLIVAAFVVGISMAVGRAGPFVGAMVATLPISAGPSYVFLAMDHDAAFIARSTVASILGVGASALFVAAYCFASRASGTIASLTAGLAALVAAIFALSLFDWTLAAAGATTAVLIAACYLATGFARSGTVSVRVPMRASDLAVRAAAVMSVVAAVSVLGAVAGPVAAGYGALMPVVFMSLVIVLQPQVGGAPVAAILSHALLGVAGLVPAFSVVNLTAEPLGSATALGLGLLTSLTWNGGLVLAGRSRASR